MCPAPRSERRSIPPTARRDRLDNAIVLARRVVLVAAVAHALLATVHLTMAWRHSLPPDGRLGTGDIRRWELLTQISASVAVLLLAAGAITTIDALYRTHDAASLFASPGFGRARVAWGWFVPVASLIVPYLVMRRFLRLAGRSTSTLPVWWACMLAGNIAIRLVVPVGSDVAGELLVAFQATATCVAGVLFVRLLADLRDGLHDQLDRHAPTCAVRPS